MGGRFIAVGQDGARIVSEDGRAWHHAQSGKEGETYRAIAFGNDRFVAVGSYGGDNIIASTTDGVAWESAKKEAKYVKYIRGLGFDGKQFMGIGGDPGSVGSSKPFFLTSPDGKSWSDAVDIPGKHIIRRIAFGNGAIVGVGDRGRRSASRDGGKTWQEAPDVKAIDTLIDIAFGQGRFVGVGLHGLRMSSEDGVGWSAPQRGEEGEHLNTVVWTGTQFAAIGFGATYFSTDGLKWERRANQHAPLTAAFGAGNFVGTQWKGRLLHSKDAVVWTEAHQSAQHLEAVCFGG
jgi:photosystem II stability/assembly factor-like uncharacterized protein